MATSTDEGDHHLQYALQLSSASVLSMVFKAAIELCLLEIIAKAGPAALLSASAIASQLPTNKPGASIVFDRIQCLLASHSFLTRSLATENKGGQSQRLYGLAPVSKYFVKSQDEESWSPMLVMMQDKVVIDFWYLSKDAVLEGGIPLYIKQDCRFAELFSCIHERF